jgi:hypothetical protein
MRDYITNHFRDDEIYFEYTHLTKRIPGKEDYSHGIHCDQCDWNPVDGSCIEKEESCCAWRSHSMILYLSECEGGEFFFYDNGIKTFVNPTPGTLVGFTSGPENIHGVNKVVSGVRYALAIWFTKNPLKAE